MFLKTVLADGQAEQAVLREMKARAEGARGDIEQTVRAIMDDVSLRICGEVRWAEALYRRAGTARAGIRQLPARTDRGA